MTWWCFGVFPPSATATLQQSHSELVQPVCLIAFRFKEVSPLVQTEKFIQLGRNS